MARLPRLYAPQVPQLVQAEFVRPLAAVSDPTPSAELDRLLEWLLHDAREYKVAVHGWLLLNDRITLLATPPDAQGLSRLMQALGRRLATHMRRGRVFAGRYRSTLVEPGAWVLPALVWLESLPVQQRYVDRAESWPWSSAAAHTGVHAGTPTGTPMDAAALGRTLLNDHVDYWQDGNTPFAREANYRERMQNGLSAAQGQRIEQALFGQWVLGDAGFVDKLSTLATRRLMPASRGRPRKTTPSV
ncbi:hypothetical protein CR159_09600 [Pollutimonas subterranea]|uniref:Transposase IS200-like domain-containing protein n=1 Tax=Pollutimonas subterranea TaxID=2045210 RepID=A0A2N4U5F1_9BURK|nr:hypothetical protein [Pollutimonas subterranea]PLC50244.1 hypothetical protein CR159_09600 [Pollutimonas subterranea]